MLHRYFILIFLILIYMCIKSWTTIENAAFRKDGIDCILNAGNNTVYIFNNDLCIKYNIKNGIFKANHGYPKKISEVFPGIPSNLNTAFLLKKNKIAFLKENKTYIFNLKTKQLDSGYPKDTKNVFDKFLVNASCVIPFGNDTFAVFKNDKYIMYKPGEVPGEVLKIKDHLPDFINNVDAGTNWGDDKNYHIFYFFKKDRYIKYKIKKASKINVFKNGNINGNSYGKTINDANWPQISALFNSQINNEKLCPSGTTMLRNRYHCQDKKGGICTNGTDTEFPKCEASCDLPFTSTGAIKYNEFVLFKIFPDHYLGENEHPLMWDNSNVYVIEPDTGCVRNNSKDKIIKWGDYIKIKNVSSQKYLSLSKSNLNNIYKIVPHPEKEVENNNYVSDNDHFRICIDIVNDECTTFYQNGVNDKDGLVGIYRIETAKLLRRMHAKKNDPNYKSFKVEDELTRDFDNFEETIKDTNLFKENNFDPELEKYYDIDGSDYRGVVNYTKDSGSKCENWNTKHQITQDTIDKYGIGDHNYCRNPPSSDTNNKKKGPWCYSSKPNTIWEYCDVGLPLEKKGNISISSSDDNYNNDMQNDMQNDDMIDDNKCNKYQKDTELEKYCAQNATDYRGTVNWTTDNMQCLKWPESYKKIYADKGIDDHNYCRNPDNSRKAWCFVNDQDNPVGFCNVGKPSRVCNPSKDDKKEIFYSENGNDYKGTQSTTIKGSECIPWNSDELGDRRIPSLNHNYCRNPAENTKEMPWCYTKNGGWEYCNIKKGHDSCGLGKSTNKILCAFAIPESKVYYVFRNLTINGEKVIIYNVLSLNNRQHESKILGIVNDITWPGMPFKDNIDAAYYNKNNIIYFFNGANVVKYDIRLKNQIGNIVSIGTEFPNLEFKSKIDCIIEKKNGLCYVIKGNSYVLFNFNTRIQESGAPNQLNNDVITNLSISNIDASITFKNNIARLFKDNYYVDIDLSTETPKQLNTQRMSIGKFYKSFWNININNPLFNKQQILVDKINLIKTYELVNKIKSKGGLEKYMEHTKENVYDISRKFNIDLDKLLEAVEYGIFNTDSDNKDSTYREPHN